VNMSKPKFNPNQPFEVLDKPKFDPTQAYNAIESDQPEVSQLESGARGALQGATMGFGDEITGGLEALFDKMSSKERKETFQELYHKHRDES